MLRSLGPQDHTKLMAYVSREPSLNLFIIADIEQYGYDPDVLEVWADEDGETFRAVLLRFHSNFMIYAPGPHDQSAVESTIAGASSFKFLIGEAGAIESYENSFDFAEIRRQFFAELTADRFVAPGSSGILSRRAQPEDAGEIVELRSLISEFSSFPARGAAEMGRNIAEGRYRYHVVTIEDAIVSSAATIAESSVSAMVGGVMTHPNHRRKGYVTACMASLCGELLSEGKTVCLFYDNPAAANIYLGLGFRNIGRWTMCPVMHP